MPYVGVGRLYARDITYYALFYAQVNSLLFFSNCLLFFSNRLLLCLGAHAQVRYTVVCLCVCVCVCVCRLLQLLKDESSASKSFYRLLVMFTWILIRGFSK